MRTKRLLLIIAMFSITLQVAAQSGTVYDVVDQMPAFPGGGSALMNFLSQNIRYPAVAEENGIQGRVIVTFVVNSDGSISDTKLAKSVDPSLDKEALRLVKSMPRWIPGRKNGTPVRVKYTIPVTFRIPGLVTQNQRQVQQSQPATGKIDGVKGIEDVFKGAHNDGRYIYFNTSSQPGNAKKVALNTYHFENVDGARFYDGMLGIVNEENHRVGFVDEQGNLVPGGFKWGQDLNYFPRFGGGAALVFTSSGMGSRAIHTWYILDKSGNATKLALGGTIHKASNFNEDGIAGIILITRNAKGRDVYTNMLINTKGQKVFRNLWFDCNGWGDAQKLGKFCDGLAKFCKDGKYGYVNRAGTIVIPAKYNEVEDFSEGLAAVQTEINGALKWMYIDTSGSRAIQIVFTNKPGNFMKGYAPVKKANGTYNYINKNGEQMLSSDVYDATEFYPNGCALIQVDKIASNSHTAVITTSFKTHVIFKHDLEPYDNDSKPIYWNGLALLSESFTVGRNFLDFNTGILYYPQNLEEVHVASDNLIQGKMKVTYHDQKTAFANINGCRWAFYIDKDEF